jgi:hypothetical protein
MGLLWRRSVGLLAVYAIALHTILWTVAPLLAGPSVDPLSVICHSVTPDEPTQAPEPVPACDHCTLCSAMAPPSPEPSEAIAQLLPAPLLEVLRPASSLAASGITTTPKLARGPPLFV